MLYPRDACKYIVQNSKHVKINYEKLEAMANEIFSSFSQQERTMQTWHTCPLNPTEKNEVTLNWILLVDLLNFSFWSMPDEKPYIVKWMGQEYQGYWSLCAAVNRAMEEGTNIVDPKVFAHITIDQAHHIFRGEHGVEMPLLDLRVKCMQEIGSALCQEFDGSFIRLLESCCHSAQTLLQHLVKYETFRDVATFHGVEVAILKKAQILIGDLWCAFDGESWGRFDDIDSVTAFADYRLPQTFCLYGAWEYSRDLDSELHADHLFPSGSVMEVEIRGNTLYSVEKLVEYVKMKLLAEGKSDVIVNDILMDHHLWDFRRQFAHIFEQKCIPFHKTRSIFY